MEWITEFSTTAATWMTGHEGEVLLTALAVLCLLQWCLLVSKWAPRRSKTLRAMAEELGSSVRAGQLIAFDGGPTSSTEAVASISREAIRVCRDISVKAMEEMRDVAKAAMKRMQNYCVGDELEAVADIVRETLKAKPHEDNHGQQPQQ